MMKMRSLKDIVFILTIGILSVFIACSSDEDTDGEAQRVADSIAQSAVDNAIIDAYIQDNGITGLTIGESGIRYGVISAGNGTFPEFNNIISVHYVGKFILDVDSVFDTSSEQVAIDNDIWNASLPYLPLTFNLTPDGSGVSRAFLGQFRIALGQLVLTMDMGAKAVLFMPSSTAYGTTGDNPDPDVEDTIPPNTPILFEFTLVNIRG